LIMRSVRDLENHIPEGQAQYEQWIGNIELLLKFRQVDMTYSERRADNQITAVLSPTVYASVQWPRLIYTRSTDSSASETTW
jgi:hypothetical protein